MSWWHDGVQLSLSIIRQRERERRVRPGHLDTCNQVIIIKLPHWHPDKSIWVLNPDSNLRSPSGVSVCPRHCILLYMLEQVPNKVQTASCLLTRSRMDVYTCLTDRHILNGSSVFRMNNFSNIHTMNIFISLEQATTIPAICPSHIWKRDGRFSENLSTNTW